MRFVCILSQNHICRACGLHEASDRQANCLLRGSEHQHQKRVGKHHQPILRNHASKWIRILWRCWHDRVPDDEAWCLAALDQRHLPRALTLPLAA